MATVADIQEFLSGLRVPQAQCGYGAGGVQDTGKGFVSGVRGRGGAWVRE